MLSDVVAGSRPPHPSLRDTFSREGRRDLALGEAETTKTA